MSLGSFTVFWILHCASDPSLCHKSFPVPGVVYCAMDPSLCLGSFIAPQRHSQELLQDLGQIFPERMLAVAQRRFLLSPIIRSGRFPVQALGPSRTPPKTCTHTIRKRGRHLGVGTDRPCIISQEVKESCKDRVSKPACKGMQKEGDRWKACRPQHFLSAAMVSMRSRNKIEPKSKHIRKTEGCDRHTGVPSAGGRAGKSSQQILVAREASHDTFVAFLLNHSFNKGHWNTMMQNHEWNRPSVFLWTCSFSGVCTTNRLDYNQAWTQCVTNIPY
eukprot:1151312-Pelagomonas_calceolata.AAC.5